MAKKETAKKDNKNKKSFFKDFKAELKKVIWPTPKQLVNNTVAVITIVLITAAIVFVLDLTFEALNKHGIDKIKETIGTNTSVTDNTTTENQENTNQEDTENTQNNEAETTENVEDTRKQYTIIEKIKGGLHKCLKKIMIW